MTPHKGFISDIIRPANNNRRPYYLLLLLLPVTNLSPEMDSAIPISYKMRKFRL